jgi:hypothetical protein
MGFSDDMIAHFFYQMRFASREPAYTAGMAAKIDLRQMLVKGKHALDPAEVCSVTEIVLAEPQRTCRLIELLWDEDPGVANRAGDVLERITRRPSDLVTRQLAEFKEPLLGLLPEAKPRKLRWNLALIVPRLPLTRFEARRTAAVLQTYIEDPASLVKTCGMTGLAGLARHDPALLPSVLDQLRIFSRSGTPAMRARSRILLGVIERHQTKPRNRASLHRFD